MLFKRNSTKSHPTSCVNFDQYANLSKYELLKKFDELEEKYLQSRWSSELLQMESLRTYLKMIHYYALVKNAYKGSLNDFNSTRAEFINKAGLKNASNPVNAKQAEDDVNNIEKIMLRYKLDFDRGFDFWVMSSLLREKFQYRNTANYNANTKLFMFAKQIWWKPLQELGAKAGLSAHQVNRIYPQLAEKIAVSKMKAMLADHVNGKTASVHEFKKELKHAADVIGTAESFTRFVN